MKSLNPGFMPIAGFSKDWKLPFHPGCAKFPA
jgi:hypothetical protein